MFQTLAAATGKARSPMVLCNDRGTVMRYDAECIDLVAKKLTYSQYSFSSGTKRNIKGKRVMNLI